MSADLAAISEAMTLGIAGSRSMHYSRARGASKAAWERLSKGTADYRSGRKQKIGFDQEEPVSPDDPAKSKP